MQHHSRKVLVLLSITVSLLGMAIVAQAQTPVPTPTLPPFEMTPTFTPTGGGGGGGGSGGGANFNGIPIEYTQNVEGLLSPTQTVITYAFRGEAGDSITIAANSTAFNPYVSLVNVYGSEIAWDDDSGGYPNALLGPFILPDTGQYQIRVSSYDFEPRGAYTLTLDKIEMQEAAYGEDVDVEFTESDRALYFAFEGKAGDVVNLSIDSNGGLDTRLRVRGRDSYDIGYDDDSGEGYDPEITRLILPYDDRYVVIVEPYTPGITGEVTLSLTKSELPSLDDGPQTVRLGDKRTYDVVTFQGESGEQVRLTARIIGGRSDYLTIRVNQNGTELSYISGNYLDELSFVLSVVQDGQVNVQLENYTNVMIEVTLEQVE